MSDPSPVPWDGSPWAQWGVSLSTPLIDPLELVFLQEAMRVQAREHPDRAAALLAGVACDLADSLPAADPWRRPDPATFGTWRDGTDLVPRDVPSIREDIGLAPLARPLEPDAVTVISNTHSGPRALAELIATLDEPVRPSVRAITWLTWRRSVYLGPGDPYPTLATFLWLHHTGNPATDEAAPFELVRRRQATAARVPDEDYLSA